MSNYNPQQNNEYSEIENIFSSLKVREVFVPEFRGFREAESKVPSPYFSNFKNSQKRLISILLSVPVAISVFAVGFYFSNMNSLKPQTTQLALLEESNTRILNEIDTLDK